MLPASLLILLATLATVPTTIRATVPNFRDLTIKIRETRGLSHPMVHAYYFKGPRERTEIIPEGGIVTGFSATLMQCDLRAVVHLNPSSKSYIVSNGPAADRSPIGPMRIRPQLPDGPDVNVTMDSIGYWRAPSGVRFRSPPPQEHHCHSAQQRRLYTARQGPTRYLVSRPARESCHESIPRSMASIFGGMYKVGPTGHRDHFVVQYTGVQPTGLIIEERSTQKEGGNTILSKTELLGVSEETLDESLFEIPPDYSQHQSPRPKMGTVAAPPVDVR